MLTISATPIPRLAALAQNSDLGARMAAAMNDLEICGAGSILGAEPSRHVAGVGFDLYVRLVGDAVTAFKKAASARDITADRTGQSSHDGPFSRPCRLAHRPCLAGRPPVSLEHE